MYFCGKTLLVCLHVGKLQNPYRKKHVCFASAYQQMQYLYMRIICVRSPRNKKNVSLCGIRTFVIHETKIYDSYRKPYIFGFHVKTHVNNVFPMLSLCFAMFLLCFASLPHLLQDTIKDQNCCKS